MLIDKYDRHILRYVYNKNNKHIKGKDIISYKVTNK